MIKSSKAFDLSDSRMRKQLRADLNSDREERSQIQFDILLEKRSGKSVHIGSAVMNLNDIIDGGRDMKSERLDVVQRRELVGSIQVSTVAFSMIL